MKVCTQCKARFTGNPARCPLDGSPLVDLPDPLMGKTIGGRYRVETKIGAGGMASVYRASHDLLGRRVAIKFLSPELALDNTQRQRFLREARATNRIKHEHIVDISDYGEENGLVYLVMELLEGAPLSHEIARGPIPPRTAIDWLTQTARALARAHELEVIHRDLKPENIFLVEKNTGKKHVKLLDFGLAHVRNEARLTALGAVFGTPEYMSPEQARGAPIGPTSDLYSLGVVFFEMLTGHLPFEGSTAELIVKHLKTPPPSARSRQPNLPGEIDTVLARMLTKDPTQRPRDAYELIDDLNELARLFPSEQGSRPTRSEALTPAGGIDKVSIPDTHPTTTDARPDAPPPPPPQQQQRPGNAQSWVSRRTVLLRAIEGAYGSGRVPAWVAQAIERVERLVEQAVKLDAELEGVARALAERESTASDARDRVGRALDELTRDESAVLRQIADLERRTERARQRMSQASLDFQRAWSDASDSVSGGELRTVDDVSVVETAARKATAWRQALQEVEEAETQRSSRLAAREDLRFQVAQLKGRLGAVNAAVEHELGADRSRATELGDKLAQVHDELSEAAASLSAHLSDHPQAGPILRGEAADRPN